MMLHGMSEQNILQVGLQSCMPCLWVAVGCCCLCLAGKDTWWCRKHGLDRYQYKWRASASTEQYPEKNISSCSHITHCQAWPYPGICNLIKFLFPQTSKVSQVAYREILRRYRQGRKMNVPQQPRNSSIFSSGLCWAHFSCSQEDSLHSLLRMTQQIVLTSGKIFSHINKS